MFKISGRKVMVSTGTKTQTVNICTTDNVHGDYEFKVRLRPPQITEYTLNQAKFASIDQLIRFLCLHHLGQVEQPVRVPRATIREEGTGDTSKVTEEMMALETHELFTVMGLKPEFRVDVCSGIGHFPAGTYDHHLPLYAKQVSTCFTDKARQIACPDLIVVHKKDKIVEVTIEFEVDTNPKNLVGNYFYVFPAEEYKPKEDSAVYRFDVTRTTHFLLACLDPREATPNDQAAVEKGKIVADWLNMASIHLLSDVDLCNIRGAHAFAGDNWPSMKEILRRQLASTCPHLFENKD
jgi:hypothetical protein